MAVEGKDYQVAANQSNPIQYQAALLGDDGKLLPRVVATNPGLNGDHVMVIYTLQISPPDGTLIRQPKTRVNTNKGFVNYEILFTGITDSDKPHISRVQSGRLGARGVLSEPHLPTQRLNHHVPKLEDVD